MDKIEGRGIKIEVEGGEKTIRRGSMKKTIRRRNMKKTTVEGIMSGGGAERRDERGGTWWPEVFMARR